MIYLEKHKNIDKIEDKNLQNKMINEIRASIPALLFVSEILEDKIKYLESLYESHLSDPYVLSAHVKTVSELKKLTRLFKEIKE